MSKLSKVFDNLTIIFLVIGFTIVMHFVHPLNGLYFALRLDISISTVRTYGILFGLLLAVIPYIISWSRKEFT
jgi:hypothetical protein